MARSVGLDIHARGVRVVEVTGRAKNVRVTRYMERTLTPRGGAPDPEELREALTEIFKGGKFSKNNVVTAVDAHDTVVREIPVPFKADDQIRKVVKYEAEHHLHDCDADDVVVQYTKISESSEGANLLVFAARKDNISRRIDYARSAGVEPLAMDLDALAFYRAIAAAGTFEETPSCVLINIGHRSTEMVFVLDGEVRALRSVRMGVDSIAHGLARDMDIDFVEADHKLHELTADDEGDDLLLPVESLDDKKETEKSHAELERDLFHQKRDDFVARLKREFVRSSAAMRSSGQPTRMVVSGPGIHVPGLLDLIGQRIGIAVEAFRPSEVFTCKLNGVAPADFDAGATVALGLALKGVVDTIDLDFRQEELRVANKFELLKNALAVTVTLLFIGLLAFSFYCVVKKRQLQERRFEPMLTEAYQSFSEITRNYNELQLVPKREKVDANYVEGSGPRHQAINRFVGKLRTMQRKLHKVVFSGGDKRVRPISSALMTWNQIFQVIAKHHEQISYFDLDQIRVKQDGVRMTIILPSIAEAERLETPLKALLKDMTLKPFTARPLQGTDRVSVILEFVRKKK